MRKSYLLATTITFAFLFLALGSPAKAQTGDNDGCRDSTLHGDYAFTISGQIFVPNGPVIQRSGVAMTHFNGNGSFTQVDFLLSSPNAAPPPGAAPTDPVTGFHTEETGTYTVNPDCTGTYTIHFPPFVGSSGSTLGAIIVVKFVLSNHGFSVHGIVSSLTLPGGAAPVPALIAAEGRKLGLIETF